MEHPENQYHSFLIRLWREGGENQLGGEWCIELESIRSGEKMLFPDLDSMLEFFHEVTQFKKIKNGEDRSTEE